MDLILSSLEILARWDVMIALLVGSIGGVLIGAIPGVGPAVAIAILLPATFSLDPIVGLTVLLGIYGSSMYGGSIPAILINTPGTAVNALTTYDGYPMTTRGEARRALSLAYSSSFFGGVFSVICLVLFAPVLAKIAPMFGSREIFLAALVWQPRDISCCAFGHHSCCGRSSGPKPYCGGTRLFWDISAHGWP